MSEIHILENPYGLFVAGEEIGRFLEQYRDLKNNFSKPNTAALQYRRASCPATGCGRCRSQDCIFSDFIRNYLDIPHAD